MKKISLLLATVILFSCAKENKNFLSISGSVKNNSEKTFTIKNSTYNKDIKINEDGTFKDTLHLKNPDSLQSYEENFYGFNVGKTQSFGFLQNGFELTFTIDGSEIEVTGKGAQNTNYIKEKIKLSRIHMNPREYFSLEKEAFKAKLGEAKTLLDGLVEKYPNLDAKFAIAEKESNTEFYKSISDNYEQQHTALAKTSKGSPSPKFVDYENYAGGKTSLDDLKGKYVYIDVWATWCGPCKREIPHLQELEKKYHGKNVEFVSISVDKPGQHDAWKNMIKEKSMSGIQLFGGTDQKFSQDYQITGIPRFILIDPQGNIVEANAPRPSDPSLISLFTSLNI